MVKVLDRNLSIQRLWQTEAGLKAVILKVVKDRQYSETDIGCWFCGYVGVNNDSPLSNMNLLKISNMVDIDTPVTYCGTFPNITEFGDTGINKDLFYIGFDTNHFPDDFYNPKSIKFAEEQCEKLASLINKLSEN